MNDGIDSQKIYSQSYIIVDDVMRMAAGIGKGALLAKVDIKSVYQLIPVHPDDILLLTMPWNGRVIIDATCMLLFGLRSAPKIFTVVADGLEWIIRQWSV